MAVANAGQFVNREGLFKKFEELDIIAETYEHPEVLTVEAMLPHVGHLPGAHSKNLFMKDKKRNLWLLSALHDRPINLNQVSKKIGAPGGLRLADEDILYNTLGVKQGCVTAFALINDTENKVKFVSDSAFFDGSFDKVYFHPLSNTATTGISSNDFLKFLKAIGHEPVLLNFKD